MVYCTLEIRDAAPGVALPRFAAGGGPAAPRAGAKISVAGVPNFCQHRFMMELSASPRRRGEACPSCERFIGPLRHCPYCGESAAPAPALRALRLSAFLLAFLGLASLYVMVRQRELPRITIDSITPMMNYAYVRVVGTIPRDPYTVQRNGELDYCSFLVDDGTGVIRVQTQREAARRLAAQNALPRRGAVVDVAGALNLRAGEDPRLRLQAVEHLRVLTALPTP
jgi:hypothetical protein